MATPIRLAALNASIAVGQGSGTEGTNTPPQSHTRTYQACIPCRKRKVRCDLGPVDNPHEPPCKRCSRESKDCYFSATRRKRKGEDEDDEGDDVDADFSGQSRKRAKSDPSEAPSTPSSYFTPANVKAADMTNKHARSQSMNPPLTPGGSIGQLAPLRRPDMQRMPTISDEEDQLVSNASTAILQGAELFHGTDALHLLARTATGQMSLKRRTASSGSLPPPSFGSHKLHSSLREGGLASRRNVTFGSRSISGRAGTVLPSPITTLLDSDLESVSPHVLEEAIQAWTKLRFVRAGWFTPLEGIAYIDYFYRYLFPLTPIALPDFQEPAKHKELLFEEPMLAVTLLTIASRYMPLPGPGAISRAFVVHEKLWVYLQRMIDRMMWAQEQFGGGFCGAGVKPTIDSNSPKGLRNFGTIESLLLLTEWHTRSLHFPPGDDSDDLMTSIDHVPSPRTAKFMNDKSPGTAANEGRKIDDWLEPIWRSDRMSWSLLANALALAHELGIMDKKQVKGGITEALQPLSRRAINIQRMLYIYFTQTSGRLGLQTMLNLDRCRIDLFPKLEDIEARKRDGIGQNGEHIQDTVLYFWCGIAMLFSEGNRVLFNSREETRAIISSGKYRSLLDEFETHHTNWRIDLEKCQTVPIYMRHMLKIEYEYMRTYLNGLALHAVFERCFNNSPQGGSSALAPEKLTKALEKDRKYIKQTIEASQSLLSTVVDGLLPGGYLKHAPVRMYFRVISVSMALLKTFALGAYRSELTTSLNLLIRASEALRNCIVDDVHVGNRFGELLDVLTERVRNRIVRISASGNGNSPPAASESPGSTTTVEAQSHQGHPRTSDYGQSMPSHETKKDSMDIPQPQVPRQVPPWNGTNGPSIYENQSDPLQGVLSSYYDPQNPDMSIMPPPDSVYQDYSNNQFQFQNGDDATYPDDRLMGGYSLGQDSFPQEWYALPLDPLRDGVPAFSTNGYAPDVNGYEMLDMLLPDQGSLPDPRPF